jgi:hypothetical protein
MATPSAGSFGAAAVYYGVSSTQTVWPVSAGGGSAGINGFMSGLLSSFFGSNLKPRNVGAYYQVTGPSGFFASRLVASMLLAPAIVGPVVAILPLGGPFGKPYL